MLRKILYAILGSKETKGEKLTEGIGIVVEGEAFIVIVTLYSPHILMLGSQCIAICILLGLEHHP